MKVLFVILVMFLSACGGGQSAEQPSGITLPVLPVISMTSSTSSAEVNTEFSLSWSVQYANACQASGAWSGAKATSGEQLVEEYTQGSKTYTLTCTGNGGEHTSSVDVLITESSTDNGNWDYKNIVYGTDDPDRQWLNIHLAYDQTKPAPVYLFAHGNGGSANGMSEKQLHTIANEGYTTISWESIPTISGATDLNIAVADAQVMFDWVLANAQSYNLDPNHIVVGGRSRGSIISWQLAHSLHPSIKGIYMYNALPQGTWQDTDNWSPVDEITIDSPPAYLVYGPDYDDDDGHNPNYVNPVIERYEELGIADKITRYVDMWGDFLDANGRWTNDAEIMHYFPEFVATLSDTDKSGYRSIFMGHSFFAPIARELPFHMTQLGFSDYIQHVESSPGETGTPLALWQDDGHRTNVQSLLDTGDIELLAMTASPVLEGYTVWVDYALSKNPNTKFVIGTPWLDFPADYFDAESYETTIKEAIETKIQVDIETLRMLYPEVEFINLSYAFAATELRHMLEAEQLPGVTELIGTNPETSLFRDTKGHGHEDGLLLDLAELIWLTSIYDINLANYQYDSGHGIDLKQVAQDIVQEYAQYFE